MAEKSVSRISDVSAAVAEQYLVDRKTSILEKGGSGRGLTTEITTLQTIFSFAIEEGLLKSSPLTGKYKPDAEAQGAEPFEPWEMYKLGKYTNDEDRLVFLLFKNTGLRRSDVASIAWSSINWTDRVLTWRTIKRKTVVTIPLVPELMDTLRQAQEEKSPAESDTILGKTPAQLYTMMVALGKRAGVSDCHPHRFRHTMAATLLEKGASIFDVARILGDTVATIDRAYGKYTDGMLDRARKIMESGVQN
jgi:integrase